jgi:hypothetical protein
MKVAHTEESKPSHKAPPIYILSLPLWHQGPKNYESEEGEADEPATGGR